LHVFDISGGLDHFVERIAGSLYAVTEQQRLGALQGDVGRDFDHIGGRL
jgi:hypothetical protein